jgi:hypothetical protein
MPGWRDRVRSALGGRRVSPRETYESLRSLALSVDPGTLELPADGSWSGALVGVIEIGRESGVATFVAVADGSVSMYTSTGGGVIGAGDHASVREAARRFLREAGDARRLLSPATEFPLPAPNEVGFHVRTADGSFTGSAPERALRGSHPLASLYAAGQDMITEIRLMTETEERARPS